MICSKMVEFAWRNCNADLLLYWISGTESIQSHSQELLHELSSVKYWLSSIYVYVYW